MRLYHSILCLLSALYCQAQSLDFSVWSLEQGLPQSQVYALCEDGQGYLWLGTQGGGICRFDGATFEVFSTDDGLPSNYIFAINKTPDGEIWAAGNAGLSRFRNKQFQPVEGLQYPAYCLYNSPDGRLLCGSARGIWQYDQGSGKLTPLRTNIVLDAKAVYCIAATPTGQLFLGTDAGLWLFDPATSNAVLLNSSAQIPPGAVQSMYLEGNLLYFTLSGSGVYALDIETQKLRFRNTAAGMERPLCLLRSADGMLWAGTQGNGLFRLDNTLQFTGTHFTESDGLPHSHIRTLLEDHNGHLWIGTSGGGLAKPGSRAFRRYDRADGLPGNRIYALAQAPDGKLWVSAAQNGLAVLDSARWRLSNADSNFLSGVKTRSLAFDTAGTLWAATEGKGLIAMSRERRVFFRRDNGFLPSDWVQKVLCDARGNVWAATAEGLLRLQKNADGGWTKKSFSTREGLPANAISALAMDARGRLWAGSNNGALVCIANDVIEAKYGARDGLPGVQITGLALDAEGHCWVAFKGAGLYVGKHKFTPAAAPRALHSQNLYLLASDRLGNLWIGAENGVERLNIGGGRILGMEHFGKNEGFSGIETCQDAVLAGANGELWFGTMNGLMRYLPGSGGPEKSTPRLHFEQISLFYKPIEASAFANKAHLLFNADGPGLELPWNQNHLSFSFKAVDLIHAGQLRYRWKLESADAEWSPWSDQLQVNYAQLAPGTYRFLVQAGVDEKTLSAPLGAVFTIRKPWWDEWAFRLPLLSALLLLILGGARWYIRRIRQKEAAQREQLELQNKLLQLEQKSLQLQMNPHFIFNALNSIQSLIATQDYAVARQEIHHFAKLMRGILHNSRKSVISLKEEMDTLEQYLRVEQFCQQNPFTFEITSEGIADPEELEIPPMLLQPFVENAVVHGISPLPYPGHISLHFAAREQHLYCTIRDNGVGRERAARLREAKKPGHQSTALQVTQERLAALGGSLQFSDVLQPDGQIGGTEVLIDFGLLTPDF